MKIYQLLSLIVFMIACSSKDFIHPKIQYLQNKELNSDAIVMVDYNDFSNLVVGNHWIYNWYEITPDSAVTKFASDSVYIEKDTLIGEKTCYIRKGTFMGKPHQMILFDSAYATYSWPNRAPIFKLLDKSPYTKQIDNLYSVLYQKADCDSLHTEAGSFLAFNYQGIYTPLPENPNQQVKINDNYYAEYVGLVAIRTQYSNSDNTLWMELSDYDVAEN